LGIFLPIYRVYICSIGHFRRNPVNRRRDFVYWFCTCPIADVPEECFGALVRGYNKKQKSPWGSLGSLVAVSLEIRNLNDLANPFSDPIKIQENPTQVIEKFPFLRGSWARLYEMFFTSSNHKTCQLFTPRQLET